MYYTRVNAFIATGRAILHRAALLLVIALLAICNSDFANANTKYSGIVVDAKSGKTLYSDRADKLRYPASLTKVMTLFILFEELESGRLNLDSKLQISRRAASQSPSKIGIRPGHPITVRTAIRALVIKSANDVAYAVAENISGSSEKFAKRMTQTARAIGMKNTTFRNPHGLPNKYQKTTARDMAVLGRAIQEKFPEKYEFFSHRTFKFRGRTYSNTNRLLGRVNGVNGIKTGYTRASGFNLMTSVELDGRHIIAVVLGGRSSQRRNVHMKDLVNRYLKKATKKGKSSYVLTVAQRRSSSSILIADIPLPKRRPQSTILALLPDSKPDSEIQDLLNRVSEAGNRSRPTSNDAQVASASAALPKGNYPTLLPKPKFARHNSTLSVSQEIPILERSIGTVSGWQVQIAATPSKSGALDILNSAKSKLSPQLQAFAVHTEEVSTQNGTHFRARFVGFESKTQATSACKSLKKAKYNCFAIFE